MLSLKRLLVLAALHSCSLSAPLHDRFEEKDLATFVTRPDIKPPEFTTTVRDESAVTPGYWFVSPYVDLRTRIPTSAFSPGQVGPHIYDHKGNLVYSGAHLVGDRTSFDFKSVIVNGSQHLSLLLDHDNTKSKFTAGAGVLVNQNFEVVSTVQNQRGSRLMNMHEFNIVDDGKSAITITYEPQMYDYSYGKGQGPYGWIGNNGFQEVDLITGELIFEWWALDHIEPSESTMEEPNGPGSSDGPWDWFHMNSVDKNADGDYLISARYTNAIYKISGRDGSIIWRLGGDKSSFKQHEFHFSSQHDARFRREDETTTVISFLNNAANGHVRTSDTSSVMVVALNTATMEATLVQSFERPDGELTKLRGNAQELPNGNYFICWSENGHISEHTSEGRVVMEAQFSSKRFVTYRATKFNFTGRPTWPPHARAFAYGVTPHSSTTAVYVSWNGATEVAKWKFWGSSQEEPRDNYELLGDVEKDGFESMFMTDGYVPYVFAEAIAANGESLGFSAVAQATTPDKWTQSQIAENRLRMQDHQRSQPDSDDEDEAAEDNDDDDNNDGGSPHHALKFISQLDAKLMQSKRSVTVAIYLWLFTAAGVVSFTCFRGCRRRRRQPWMKSEM